VGADQVRKGKKARPLLVAATIGEEREPPSPPIVEMGGTEKSSFLRPEGKRSISSGGALSRSGGGWKGGLTSSLRYGKKGKKEGG